MHIPSALMVAAGGTLAAGGTYVATRALSQREGGASLLAIPLPNWGFPTAAAGTLTAFVGARTLIAAGRQLAPSAAVAVAGATLVASLAAGMIGDRDGKQARKAACREIYQGLPPGPDCLPQAT